MVTAYVPLRCVDVRDEASFDAGSVMMGTVHIINLAIACYVLI